MKKVAWFVGTGSGVGLAPVAPGTFGTAAALLIYYVLPVPSGSPIFLSIILVGLVVGIWATGILSTDNNPDPGKVVWDEYVGFWITCFLLPKTWGWLIFAFFIFRILDILKPWPIRRVESLPKGWGIMLDDVLAGIYGNLCINITRILFLSVSL
ncbi:MAG: phosphatidylglycerophosphatase A [Chloroflexota bacterium]|nr:phosphatidylglycerophosphatase A [Chloroflexota bacterium]